MRLREAENQCDTLDGPPTLRGKRRYSRYNVDSQLVKVLHWVLQPRYRPVTLTLTPVIVGPFRINRARAQLEMSATGIAVCQAEAREAKAGRSAQ